MTPRPRTTAMPGTTAVAAAGSAGGDRVPDAPETWGWNAVAPATSSLASDALPTAVAETPSRASTANTAAMGRRQRERLSAADKGSWFDDDAWSRIRADRASKKAAQRQQTDEHWRTTVHPWLVQKDRDARETHTQKRLAKAKDEAQRLHRHMEENKTEMRLRAHMLLKDMRSLLVLDELQGMDPKEVKKLDRWVDGMMAKHDVPISIMSQVEYMHKSLIRALFEDIDVDGSGGLDGAEVRLLASKLEVRLSEAQAGGALLEMQETHGVSAFREGNTEGDVSPVRATRFPGMFPRDCLRAIPTTTRFAGMSLA